jgi:LysR family glycine cleavage system transcriptional activator
LTRLLPSLDLLRGFEAAARHLSFTTAAKELFLTQSAVSRQIQTLEEQLGVALFERRHRAIVMTEAGQELYRTTAQALRDIEETASKIRAALNAPQAVTVSCTLGFASLWLVPRLAGFHSRFPGVDLRISASNQIVDIEREGIEVAIRYCPPAHAPAGAIKLFGEEVLPVCSPSLVQRHAHPLLVPDDLQHHMLLHLELSMAPRPALLWPAWLEMAGVAHLKPAGSLRFSHYDQLITAAVEGQGVALSTTPLVQRLMRDGQLIAPFTQRLASPRAYHLVTRTSSAARPEVRQLVDWLTSEAGTLDASSSTMG